MELRPRGDARPTPVSYRSRGRTAAKPSMRHVRQPSESRASRCARWRATTTRISDLGRRGRGRRCTDRGGGGRRSARGREPRPRRVRPGALRLHVRARLGQGALPGRRRAPRRHVVAHCRTVKPRFLAADARCVAGLVERSVNTRRVKRAPLVLVLLAALAYASPSGAATTSHARVTSGSCRTTGPSRSGARFRASRPSFGPCSPAPPDASARSA